MLLWQSEPRLTQNGGGRVGVVKCFIIYHVTIMGTNNNYNYLHVYDYTSIHMFMYGRIFLEGLTKQKNC